MLQILAISAPGFISRASTDKTYSFSSKTPFSLHNALRDAIAKAIKGEGAWAESNFASTNERQKAVCMIEYWEEEKEYVSNLLDEIRPNLLLIGSMTLCFPGAIEIAKLAKEKYGDDIFIVLGGKHVNETFFASKKGIQQLVSSPLLLMSEKIIPPIFDIVISGDGEKIITGIGEVIHKLTFRNSPLSDIHKYKDFLEACEGDWIAGQLLKDNSIRYFQSRGYKIDYDDLALSVTQFPPGPGFKILNTTYTAHAYSDMSKGCSYNCSFCSEKSYINGILRLKGHDVSMRLFKQFLAVKHFQETNNNGSISIFVEDSIFLGGMLEKIKDFNNLLSKNNLAIPFGCQFTLDTFLDSPILDEIKKLTANGLKYVAFGIETTNENIASKFSKNTNHKEGWTFKTESVVLVCKKLNIDCGMFLLWGLGETQEERIEQLRKIIYWKFYYRVNIEVGLNIATQHPLRDQDNKYHYTDWGTAKESLYLPIFTELFGEASEKYKLSSINFPTVKELRDLKALFFQLNEPLINHES